VRQGSGARDQGPAAAGRTTDGAGQVIILDDESLLRDERWLAQFDRAVTAGRAIALVAERAILVPAWIRSKVIVVIVYDEDEMDEQVRPAALEFLRGLGEPFTEEEPAR